MNEAGASARSPYMIAWAKKRPEKTGTVYHPLRNHCLDAVAVAQTLWSEVFRPRDRCWFATQLGLSVEAAGPLACFLAGSHDVGKLTYTFQKKDPLRLEILLELGLKPVANTDCAPHGTESARILADFLQQHGWSRTTARPIAAAIGGHHGRLISNSQLKKQPCSRRWTDAQDALLATLMDSAHCGPLPHVGESFGTSALVVLAGFTSVSDWIASDEDRFPYDDSDTSASDYLQERSARARKALKQLGWSTSRGAPNFGGYDRVFGISAPSPLQKTVLTLAEQLDSPSLTIIEAPMGDGKTEAAFAAASVFQHRFGLRGLYCALPTQATTDQMFLRLVEMFKREDYLEPQTLALVHSQAPLSLQYEELLTLGREYLNPSHLAEMDHKPNDPQSNVIASEWFSYSKRGLLAPSGAGTIDQSLQAVLLKKHFFVRLFGLWGKVLIIDEVHAFDAYMSTIMERLLEWVARLDVPVVLLSATLPAAKRQAFASAFARGLGTAGVTLCSAQYPRVTTVTKNQVSSTHVAARAPSKTIALKQIASAELIPQLNAALHHGGNVAVVCNTVERARRLFLELENSFPGEVDLLHARFLAGDRKERVDRMLSRVSRNAARPFRSILVSTQIIEQSLDIDFDLIVTEHCPIDLLLQRLGRLHRHAREHLPMFAKPEAWILAPELKNGIPQFGDSVYIYAAHILLRSWRMLDGLSHVTIPDDVESLIEALYAEEFRPEPGDGPLLRTWNETRAQMLEEIRRHQDTATSVYLSGPDEGWVQLASRFETLSDDDARFLNSRLFRPSVQLLVLWQKDDNLCADKDCRVLVPRSQPPTLETLRILMRCSVNLPLRKTDELGAESSLPLAWQKRAALKGHQLLTLDAKGSGQIGNLRLVLNDALGLCRA